MLARGWATSPTLRLAAIPCVNDEEAATAILSAAMARASFLSFLC